MSKPSLETVLAYGVHLGGPCAWNLPGTTGGGLLRLPWFDETLPGHDFLNCVHVHLDAESAAEFEDVDEHGISVFEAVDVSLPGWNPHLLPVRAGDLPARVQQRLLDPGQAVRYVLVVDDSVVYWDTADGRPPAPVGGWASRWSGDAALRQVDWALDALGLQADAAGPLWCRTAYETSTGVGHDVQAFEVEGDGWALVCATCPKARQGLTADEAYARVAECAPNPEPWITPSGKPGYRRRRT